MDKRCPHCLSYKGGLTEVSCPCNPVLFHQVNPPTPHVHGDRAQWGGRETFSFGDG